MPKITQQKEISLSARVREVLGKKVKILRKKDILPAVLYGPKLKSLALQVDLKELEKVYKEAGESSLISLKVNDKKLLVLIHEIQRDPMTDKFLHVDFYQAPLKEKVEAAVSLVFEGISQAVKELGGTLVKNIVEVEVKALPQNLPHEIVVNIEGLKTFEDDILIKDLKVSEAVEILKEPKEIVASVNPPEAVEEELEKPIEEKVEEVEKVEKKEKEETEETEEEETKEPKEEKEKKGK